MAGAKNGSDGAKANMSSRKNIWKLIFAVDSLWVYLRAQFVVSRQYQRKYLQSKWFTSPYGNIGAQGWRWVIDNARACRLNGVNTDVPWPVSARISVVKPENITFDPDDMNNFQGFGNYYQAQAPITLGKGTYIAPNVGIITANHDPSDLKRHLPSRPVTLGENCWIGMNSVILPGVTLGDRTVVGAGSVVTKSFLEGWCVVAGNPAKVIKYLPREP